MNNSMLAVYYVHWTLGGVREHGATFDLILGEWHEGAAAGDRRAVSLACRLFEQGPSVMVIDAHDRDFAQSPIAGVPLSRSDVIGTPLAPLVFAILDAIWLKDSRLTELTAAHSARGSLGADVCGLPFRSGSRNGQPSGRAWPCCAVNIGGF